MNQRFSITPANAATDLRLSDSVHRTLTVIGIFGDKNGWCWPSQSTLAKLRGVSRKTINIHIKDLIKFGYLNIAPRYDDETGAQKSNMMQIKFDFAPDVTGGVTPKRLQGGGSQEGYTPHNPQEVTHNAPLNAPIKDLKETTTISGGGDFGEVIYCYENNIGLMTPLISDQISAALEEFPKQYLIDAIEIATAANNRSWRYINGILKKWRVNGRQDIPRIGVPVMRENGSLQI